MTKNILAGFTLVELLVVIAILAILSTLGVANFQTAKTKAQDLERKSELSVIAKGLEAYVNDHNSYPLSDPSGKIICQPPATTCDWGAPFTDSKTTYIPILPEENNTSSSYLYNSADGSSYILYAVLQNTNDPDVTVFTPSVNCGSSLCNYKITSSNNP